METLEQFMAAVTKEMERQVARARTCGAIEPSEVTDVVLYRMVLQIVAADFMPPHASHKKMLRNLQKFI